MIAVLYARVSTDKQAEKYGISSQIELKKSCLERGWFNVPDGDKGVFIDMVTPAPN